MSVITGLTRSFILRDLVQNRIRTILTIAGIALGVAVMVAISVANQTALMRFEDNVNLIAGRTNLEIVSNCQPDLDERALALLQFLWSKDVLFTPVIDQLVVTPGKPADVVQILGIDMLADTKFRPFTSHGNGGRKFDADIFNLGNAYVGEKFAQKHHIKRGDKFDIIVNDQAKKLIAADVISYDGPGKAFGGNVLVMDIGTAQDMLGLRGRINRIDIIAPEKALESIRQKLALELPGEFLIQRPERRGIQVSTMLAAFQYNLAALSLIAMLVGMFVIYNTMSITILRKRSDIGILRSMGTSKFEIFIMFLCQVLILGVAGSLLGLVVGIGSAHFAVDAVSRTVRSLYTYQPACDAEFSASTLCFAFCIGVLFTAAAAIAPLIEAVSVPPSEAQRRGSFDLRVSSGSVGLAFIGVGFLILAVVCAFAPAVGGFPIFGYISASLAIFAVALCMPVCLSRIIRWLHAATGILFGCEGKLALVSLTGSLGRTSVAVSSLMLGIAMMVSLATMIGSFRQTVILWVNQSLRADLYVEPQSRIASHSGSISLATVQQIRQLKEVGDVDAFVHFHIIYNGKITNLGAGDFDVLKRRGGLLFTDGEQSSTVFRRLQDEPDCLVTESFATRNNVHKGDRITLNSPSGQFTVKVQQIYFDYASDLGYIVLPAPLFHQHFSDNYATTLGIYLNPEANPDKVRSSILDHLGNSVRLNIRTNRQLREEVLKVFDNTFAITYALHAISIGVAILGVMNTLFAMSFEMKRDFAILKYLGASANQMRRLVFIQAGALGLMGTTIGLLVGIALSFLLINVINKQSFGWTIQLSIPSAYLLQSFLLIMLSSIASGAIPAYQASRDISPEAVRAE